MSMFQACCSAPKMEVLTSASYHGSAEIHRLIRHIKRTMSTFHACCSAPKMEVLKSIHGRGLPMLHEGSCCTYCCFCCCCCCYSCCCSCYSACCCCCVEPNLPSTPDNPILPDYPLAPPPPTTFHEANTSSFSQIPPPPPLGAFMKQTPCKSDRKGPHPPFCVKNHGISNQTLSLPSLQKQRKLQLQMQLS